MSSPPRGPNFDLGPPADRIAGEWLIEAHTLGDRLLLDLVAAGVDERKAINVTVAQAFQAAIITWVSACKGFNRPITLEFLQEITACEFERAQPLIEQLDEALDERRAEAERGKFDA